MSPLFLYLLYIVLGQRGHTFYVIRHRADHPDSDVIAVTTSIIPTVGTIVMPQIFPSLDMPYFFFVFYTTRMFVFEGNTRSYFYCAGVVIVSKDIYFNDSVDFSECNQAIR